MFDLLTNSDFWGGFNSFWDTSRQGVTEFFGRRDADVLQTFAVSISNFFRPIMVSVIAGVIGWIVIKMLGK